MHWRLHTTDTISRIPLDDLSFRTFEDASFSSETETRNSRVPRFDDGVHANAVTPGIATVGSESGPHSYAGGVKSSFDASACSQVMVLPV